MLEFDRNRLLSFVGSLLGPSRIAGLHRGSGLTNQRRPEEDLTGLASFLRPCGDEERDLFGLTD